MFGVIVRRELLSHIRSLRFSASFILCFAMMIASVHLLAESQIGEIIPAMDTYSDGLVIEWWNKGNPGESWEQCLWEGKSRP